MWTKYCSAWFAVLKRHIRRRAKRAILIRREIQVSALQGELDGGRDVLQGRGHILLRLRPEIIDHSAVLPEMLSD